MRIKLDSNSKALHASDWSYAGYFEDGPIPSPLGKKMTGKESDFMVAPRNEGGAIHTGLGKRSKWTLEKIRRQAAKAAAQAKSFKAASLAVDLDSLRGDFSTEEAAAAAVEGIRLSSYQFNKYKTKPAPAPSLAEVVLVARQAAAKEVKKSASDAEMISEAVCFARNLANEPANVMTPPAFAAAVKTMASKNGLLCKVLGKSQIKGLKMGGVLAVSQGSSFDPQFIILENKATSSAHSVVLVGKGITFDTGGISLKPGADMDKMKFDMCGAAAVAGAMKAIAHLSIRRKVIGLIPVCENMPSSKAQRPGDIIRFLNGKTAEVLNTDAEGRLILADALAYAKRYNPAALIDIATLTGACAATFSDLAIGLMGTDQELVAKIKKAGDAAGERVWELPLWEEYGELIRATYADIQNISKRNAGTITAGMFLKEFADHTPAWAHLDIAGTAWNNGGAKPLSPIGATGVGVRLFVELIKKI